MSILITLEKHLINQLGRDVTNHINNYIQYNDTGKQENTKQWRQLVYRWSLFHRLPTVVSTVIFETKYFC
jgi:predicted methyltransferase